LISTSKYQNHKKSQSHKSSNGLPDHLHPRFLSGLTTAERDAVLSAATHRKYPDHTVIVHHDEPAERLFLLTSGLGRQFVITSDGRKIILDWLSAGRFFGGATLVSCPCRYLASTEVVSDSCALVWDRKSVRELVTKIPRLLDNALSIAVTEHLAWSIATRVSLATDDAAGRIANLLVSLACGIGEMGEDGIRIQVANEELAAGANVTPFTTSRILSEWQREGILKKGRGKILLQRPELLIASR